MKLNQEQVKKLVRDVLATRPGEIDCQECLEQLDRFVEMTLAGQDASSALPLVQHHLEQCGSCREEFEALLAVLKELG
jgi:predicted anti-sigma-YlaC factor YlaD